MPDGRMIVHNYGHCGYGIMSSPGTSFQVLMWTQNHYLALPFRCSCERIITWHILSGIVKNHYLNLPFRYCCKRIIVWLFLSSIAVKAIIILIFLSGIVVKEIIINHLSGIVVKEIIILTFLSGIVVKESLSGTSIQVLLRWKLPGTFYQVLSWKN